MSSVSGFGAYDTRIFAPMTRDYRLQGAIRKYDLKRLIALGGQPIEPLCRPETAARKLIEIANSVEQVQEAASISG
jgi:hypothetical protein